jgi:hypothetical protein
METFPFTLTTTGWSIKIRNIDILENRAEGEEPLRMAGAGVGVSAAKTFVCGPKPSFWVNRQHLHAKTQNSHANVDDSLAGSLFNRPGKPSGR